jgi:hypothetical protein
MIPTKLPGKLPVEANVIQPYDDSAIPDGNVLWLPMDDDGLVLRDLSGHLAGATDHGTVRQGGPNSGYVRRFDGTDDYVDLTGLVVSSVNQTYEWWLCVQTPADLRLIDIETGRKLIDVASSGIIGRYDSVSNETYFAPGTGLTDGAWTHLVVVEQHGATPVMYKNGVQYVTAETITGRAIGGAVILGADYTHSSTWFKGLMGCFRLYDRPLTQAEVSALYTQDRATYDYTAKSWALTIVEVNFIYQGSSGNPGDSLRLVCDGVPYVFEVSADGVTGGIPGAVLIDFSLVGTAAAARIAIRAAVNAAIGSGVTEPLVTVGASDPIVFAETVLHRLGAGAVTAITGDVGWTLV